MRKKKQHEDMKRYMLDAVQNVRQQKELKSNANTKFTFPMFLKTK